MPGFDTHKFIFLCGLHRSGTSPLFRILRDHPQISGFRDTGVPEDEGQHLQSIYPSAGVYGGPGRFGFAAEAHMTESSPLASRGNAELLFREWSSRWDTSREFLLEKSPPNLIRTRFLQRCFPNSHFIVIVRHPIAVSLATLKFVRLRLARLLEHWKVCHELFEADRPFLNNVLVIRYEDLCTRTSEVLMSIKEAVGLNPALTARLETAANERYFERWSQFAQTAPGTTVRNDLITCYESYFQTYGYTLCDPAALSPFDPDATTTRQASSA